MLATLQAPCPRGRSLPCPSDLWLFQLKALTPAFLPTWGGLSTLGIRDPFPANHLHAPKPLAQHWPQPWGQPGLSSPLRAGLRVTGRKHKANPLQRETGVSKRKMKR